MAGRSEVAQMHVPQPGEAVDVNNGLMGRMRRIARSRTVRFGAAPVLTVALLGPQIANATAAQAETANPAAASTKGTPAVDNAQRDSTPAAASVDASTALPGQIQATKIVTVTPGQTETSIAVASLKQAHIPTTERNITEVVHATDGLNQQYQADHIKPGDRLEVYLPKVDATITIVGEAKFPKATPSDIVSLQKAVLKTWHYEEGKTFEDHAVRQGDEQLVTKINNALTDAATQGSPVGQELKDLGINPADLGKVPTPPPAQPHKQSGGHGNEEASEAKVSASQIRRDVQAAVQTRDVVRTTLKGQPDAWTKEQNTTIPGVKLSDAQTNPINGVTQGMNPGLNFHHMDSQTDKKTHKKIETPYYEPSQLAKIFLAGIGTLSHNQLESLKGKIPAADFNRLEEIAELNQQSNRIPQAELTQEQRQAAEAFMQLAQKYSGMIAKYKDNLMVVIQNPHAAEKFKGLFIKMYQNALASSAGNGSEFVQPNTSEEWLALGNQGYGGTEIASAPTQGSEAKPTPTNSYVPLNNETIREDLIGQGYGQTNENAAHSGNAFPVAEVAVGTGALVAGLAVVGGVLFGRGRRRKEEQRNLDNITKKVKDNYEKEPLREAVKKGKLEFTKTTAETIEEFVDAQIERYNKKHPNGKLNAKGEAMLTAIYLQLYRIQKDVLFAQGKTNQILSTTLETDEEIIDLANKRLPLPDDKADATTRALKHLANDPVPYIHKDSSPHIHEARRILEQVGVTVIEETPIAPTYVSPGPVAGAPASTRQPRSWLPWRWRRRTS